MTSMSYKPEPAMWPCDTGQRIPCFDRVQLTLTGISNIKDVNLSLHLMIKHLLSWHYIDIERQTSCFD